jgi:Restriction endonuclease
LNKLGAAPTIHGLPTDVADLRALAPFEFQHWIIQRVSGHESPRRTADMGVDGYSFMERLPIQVKQSERVGRNVVDNFETAIRREGKHKGYIVAFSYTRGAMEEVARLRREGELEIVLVRVADVIRVGDLIDAADREGRVPDLSQVAPDLMGLFSALQQAVQDRLFPPAPTRASKPSAEALTQSARRRKPAQQRLPVT